MARMMYCWRCGQDVPMLDEDEWAVMAPIMGLANREVMDYIRLHGVSLDEARLRAPSALVKYQQLTGVTIDNHIAIYHHRAANFGPPCTHCGRPLRTPRASHCAECGTLRPSAAESAQHP